MLESKGASCAAFLCINIMLMVSSWWLATNA
jgi:hypothetical protein